MEKLITRRATVELRVLNLNFWGLKWVPSFVCKDRQMRLNALVEVLSSEDSANWDFVVLEEVWSNDDYIAIADSVRRIYPHSHYFYSGVIGSGVCVFSKGQIISVLSHAYSLNGYAHKILHGDWFGGKVVGLCKIAHKGLRVNLYATHIHAEYNRVSDEYLPHRISQAYELSQFIRMTNSDTDDVNIVAGDFNFEPDDLGYAIVRRFADLKDAWMTRLDLDSADDGNTCNTPDNIYSICEGKDDRTPRGKRIDYILYGQVQGRTGVTCGSCQTVLNRIPGSKLCYSDHKGIEAVLEVGSPDSVAPTLFSPAIGPNVVPTFENTFDKALAVLDSGVRRINQNRQVYMIALVVLFSLLIGTAEVDRQSLALARWSMNALRVTLVMVITFCFWSAVILNRIEYHALLAARNAMIIQRKWDDAQSETSTSAGESEKAQLPGVGLQLKHLDSKNDAIDFERNTDDH
ncbi:putative neutral sphingomyelinase [Hypsibius exemplaris]|uniref:sphingomyelin phosphodiesterase n=1 Tax=Hypsibius exemplaris TaxID=2072580 RepID=A0A9X6RKM5_HYPEX|nr:putative neutral sphingomyelinase [Hypsibius exemplaris]